MSYHPIARSRLICVAAAASGVLLIAGCGSSSSEESPATAREPGVATESTVDPCGLVDRERLEAAVGAPLTQAGPAYASSRGMACSWAFPSSGAAPGGLTITAWVGNEFFSSAMGEPLAGLGDEARIDPGLGAVLLRSGTNVAMVQILGSAGMETTKEVAHLVDSAL